MSKRISFEFFPPKTEQGREKLLNTQQKLLAKKPEFFSCTFGAGGSTRDYPRQMVDLLREQHADTARKQPRVNSRKIGAPPGTYDRRYHATAAACSAEKSRTRMYEWRTSAA